jgi:hypothetical protein
MHSGILACRTSETCSSCGVAILVAPAEMVIGLKVSTPLLVFIVAPAAQ